VTTVNANHEPMLRIEMEIGKHTLSEIEHEVIQAIVKLADYNKSHAAKLLGLTRFALDRRLKKIEDPE